MPDYSQRCSSCDALAAENKRLREALGNLVRATDAIVCHWDEKWVQLVKTDMRPDYRDFFTALDAAREAWGS